MTTHLHLPSSEAQSPRSDPSADPGALQVHPVLEHQRWQMSRERMFVVEDENHMSDCTLAR